MNRQNIIPPSNPIKPPINGKSHMFSAVVKMKSSFPPTGMMVRKDSKSLKVFIAFTGDIYLPTLPIENIGFIVTWMAAT